MTDQRFFNLLKPIQEPKSSWDKIYDFILGNARIVLLIVEIIMVGLFFAKVIVDNVEKNKLQEFEAVQLQLKSLEDQYEEKFRSIQARTVDYIDLWSVTKQYYPILEEVSEYIGNPTNQFSLTLSNNGTVTIEGYESLETLRGVESAMKNSDTFINVGINALSLDQSDIIKEKGRYALTAFIEDSLFIREPL